MSWIKSGENLYFHEKAPFVLEKVDLDWGIRDTRDKSQFIPFTDIFNNPVFPIDLSNANVIVKTLQSLGIVIGASFQTIGAIIGNTLTITNTILGKHIRGEASNTPNTPTFSYQGDANTGLGWNSEGVQQLVSNGNVVSVINEFGNLNGILNTDFRNLIAKEKTLINNLSSNTTSTVQVGTGVGFSYTPKKIGSKLKIQISASRTNQTWTSGSGGFGYGAIYHNLSGILAAGASVSGSTIIENEIMFSSGDSQNNASQFNWVFEYITTDLNQRYFSLTMRTNVTTVPIGLRATSSFLAIVEEYT